MSDDNVSDDESLAPSGVEGERIVTGDHSTSVDSSSRSQIAHVETASMNRSKIMVYVALFAAAMGVGTLTYFFLRNQEERTFQTAFVGLSALVFQLTDQRALSKYSAVTEVAIAVETDAQLQVVSWPNFTLRDFDIRTHEGLITSGNELAFFAPIVNSSAASGWDAYVAQEEWWLRKDLADAMVFADPGRVPHIHGHDEANQTTHVPIWLMTPVPFNASIINFDWFSLDWFRPMATNLLLKNKVAQSPVVDLSFILPFLVDVGLKRYDLEEPRSILFHPAFSAFYAQGNGEEAQKAVGFVGVVVPWGSYFTDLLPENEKGLIVDVDNTCGSHFTYVINGDKANYINSDDKPDPKYKNLKQVYQLASKSPTFDAYVDTIENNTAYDCRYTLTVYPSQELHDSYTSSKPLLYAFIIVLVFCITAAVFLFYDLAVQRRQRKIIATAEKTTAIVSALFPKSVQKRMMEDEQTEATKAGMQKGNRLLGAKSQIKEFLGDDRHEGLTFGSKPIADLFPEATIMFADLVGFTAWSSMREPSHVFMLLETIYHEFDMLANRRRIFKVETVGDCYVAAAGLPDPRKDHAVAMARFAHDCLKVFGDLTKKLEVTLGPDTTDLGVRVGIHSGPVTAGVLRGEKARFQLFGDTVNTTARIETTGAKNKIHVSQETADLLSKAGKAHWLLPRNEKVQAKGKGEMTTFWLELRNGLESGSSHGSSKSDTSSGHDQMTSLAKPLPDSSVHQTTISTINFDEKQTRLVNWNTDVLVRLLKCIVARREASGVQPDEEGVLSKLERSPQLSGSIVLDEVQDVILLPTFDPQAAMRQRDPASIELEEQVTLQLQAYVGAIAQLYRSNPFHNFEHVSHVTMSATKLLARIVAPELEVDGATSEKTLHDHTYGITSDPLTQFSCVFSALIHDVDHQGVPNSQLIHENAPVAIAYRNKSVAEQNSVDIAWNLLMDDSYSALRRTIYATVCEYRRFRQLVVNSVMATDIMDKDLGAARKDRWQKVFAEEEGAPPDGLDIDINRKATIVIEHLIQASDVAHTMQHWHVYRKWNERLFLEMYKAYKDGRSDTDPSQQWYEGEIGFFDFYIIPLAKKLKDCGVFGVSSDESLNYAEKNRQEWVMKGKEIVEKMMESAKSDDFGV